MRRGFGLLALGLVALLGPRGAIRGAAAHGGAADPAAGAAKKSLTSFDQWVFWWNHNNDAILAAPRTGPAPTAKERATIAAALLRAMDPAARLWFQTAANAHVALAKTTDDPLDLDPLLATLRAPPVGGRFSIDPVVREYGTLSLGLLSRTGPRKPFEAAVLDQVREACFGSLDDPAVSIRCRAFAANAVALLIGQPTAAKEPVAARIARALRDRRDRDTLVALLLALSLCEPSSVAEADVAALSTCVASGRLYGALVDDVVAAHATTALSRLAGPAAIDGLVKAMRLPKGASNAARSAALALGRLGARSDAATRAALLPRLLEAIHDATENTTKDFGLVAVAEILGAEIAGNGPSALDAAKGPVAAAGAALLDVARDGRWSQRPYGALGLGLLLRAMGPVGAGAAPTSFPARALAVLRAGIDDKRMDARSRAAFVVAVGLARDEDPAVRTRLLAAIRDPLADSEFRGYAAQALALAGTTSPAVEAALLAGARDARSGDLRAEAGRALAILRSESAFLSLSAELDATSDGARLLELIPAIAATRDPRAISRLVAILGDDRLPDEARAAAASALGAIGDGEPAPALSRLTTGLNYRASSDALDELWSVW